MRFWIDVFTLTNVYQGTVWTAVTAAKSSMLDGAGSISITFARSDEAASTLLLKERKVVIFKEQDGYSRYFASGIIRDITVNVADKTMLTATGPDVLDGLKRRNVSVGRSYSNTSVYNILTSLLGLVPGWYPTVSDGVGNQTARFDGVSVLKAVQRMADELGMHLREGQHQNELEFGPFGEDIGVMAMAFSPTHEVNGNDNLLQITSLTVKSSTRGVINRVMPLGAGEGIAAFTMKDAIGYRGTAYGQKYDILTTTGPDGRTIYYLQDDESISLYDIIEGPPITFKEIGPISNAPAAKVLAACALYDAAAAWLERNAVSLETYSLNVSKVNTQVRPGNKIYVKYADDVRTATGSFSPVSLDDTFWVMKTTETIAEAGSSMSMDVATVDRFEKTVKEEIVGVLESMSVKNVSVQNYLFWSENTYTDMVQVYFPGVSGRQAKFKLEVDDSVLDVTRIRIRFKTRPFFSLVRIPAQFASAGTNIDYVFDVLEGDQHPKKLQLLIDGVDVSSQFVTGGLWNPGSSDNTALDVTCDITDIIIANGIYNEHTIVFQCGTGSGDYPVPGYAHAALHGTSSSGIIELNIRIEGIAQGIKTG